MALNGMSHSCLLSLYVYSSVAFGIFMSELYETLVMVQLHRSSVTIPTVSLLPICFILGHIGLEQSAVWPDFNHLCLSQDFFLIYFLHVEIALSTGCRNVHHHAPRLGCSLVARLIREAGVLWVPYSVQLLVTLHVNEILVHIYTSPRICKGQSQMVLLLQTQPSLAIHPLETSIAPAQLNCEPASTIRSPLAGAC